MISQSGLKWTQDLCCTRLVQQQHTTTYLKSQDIWHLQPELRSSALLLLRSCTLSSTICLRPIQGLSVHQRKPFPFTSCIDHTYVSRRRKSHRPCNKQGCTSCMPDQRSTTSREGFVKQIFELLSAIISAMSAFDQNQEPRPA